MNKELNPENDPLKDLVLCYNCGRLVEEGEIELKFGDGELVELCPYCNKPIRY